MFHTFYPILLVVALALLIPFSMIILPQILAVKKGTARKLEPYECGVDAITGDSKGRFSVKYFTIALCFLVFDIEVVFLFPWAVLFRTLGVLGIVEMAVFIGVLLAGLVYIWKKGVLTWE